MAAPLARHKDLNKLPDWCVTCDNRATTRCGSSRPSPHGRTRTYFCNQCGARWQTHEHREDFTAKKTAVVCAKIEEIFDLVREVRYIMKK
jgi:hypothetical protein